MHSGDFADMRPVVLGHRLQVSPDGQVYRLVEEEGGEVLTVGDHRHCAEFLVQRLLELHGAGHLNLALPTLGAKQFWADVYWFGAWRIQENVLSGHHRLLDPSDTRHAWGSRNACRAVLERERQIQGWVPDTRPLVVLLHGLGRSHSVWDSMAAALREQNYQVAALAYPSTRRSIAEHAAQLDDLLDDLEGPREVSFVTHSLGALVVRSSLAGNPDWSRDLRPQRVVMIAPPSQGSSLARSLADFLPFAMIAGPAARELATDTLRTLPAPPCPFGILAAGRGAEDGYNPWLPGDDDGIVSIEETRLAGAADHLVVHGLHTFIMNDPQTISATLQFLQFGNFGGHSDR